MPAPGTEAVLCLLLLSFTLGLQPWRAGACAEEVLEDLERKGDAKGRRKAMRDMVMPEVLQMTLFAAEPDHLTEELKALPVDELIPLEACTRLYEL